MSEPSSSHGSSLGKDEGRVIDSSAGRQRSRPDARSPLRLAAANFAAALYDLLKAGAAEGVSGPRVPGSGKEAADEGPRGPPPAARPAASLVAAKQAMLDHLGERADSSIEELAAAASVSRSTALKTIALASRAGEMEKTGTSRRSRYRAVAAADDAGPATPPWEQQLPADPPIGTLASPVEGHAESLAPAARPVGGTLKQTAAPQRAVAPGGIAGAPDKQGALPRPPTDTRSSGAAQASGSQTFLPDVDDLMNELDLTLLDDLTPAQLAPRLRAIAAGLRRLQTTLPPRGGVRRRVDGVLMRTIAAAAEHGLGAVDRITPSASTDWASEERLARRQLR